VVLPDKHRPISQQTVDLLKESISRIGLQYPIGVLQYDGDDDEMWGKFIVNVGNHRYEALRQLGIDRIPLVCFTDPAEAALWEIDENLCRAELSPAEEADHLKRRKELFKSQSGKSSPSLGGRGKTGFAKDTAQATGKSKRAINQAIRRAEKIVPDLLEEVKGTPIDKGVELDALAKLPEVEQRRVVEEVKAGGGDSVRGIHLVAEKNRKSMEAHEKKWNAPTAQLKRLKTEWDNASWEVQEKFLKYVNRKNRNQLN